MMALTIEQQKDLVRRMSAGCRFGSEMQEQDARLRTDAEKWRIADELMQEMNPAQQFTEADAETDGMTLQQQRFLKLRIAK